MPRPVDHDQRRTQIARAFQRLLAQEGFGAVSFAKVAAEAGVSIGLIQHYFLGKDVLLRFAYDDAVSRLGERVLARVNDGGTTADVLLNTLVELLPLDEERDVEYRVRQGLAAQALHNPGLADVARRSGRGLLDHVTAAVEQGKTAGEVAPELDAELAARLILAAVQGLADQVVLSDEFPVREVLRQAIAAVFATVTV